MRGVEVDKEGNQSDIRKEMVMYIVQETEPKSEKEALSFWKEHEPVL